MANANFVIPLPANEKARDYMPGSEERSALKKELENLRERQMEIPLVIGGEEMRTGRMGDCILPHDHHTTIGRYHQVREREVGMALDAACTAQKAWAATEWHERAAIFLRAAEMLSGPWRYRINAANMLGQSKNLFQAEIDSACELIDFLRFNCHYAMRIFEQQPYSPPGAWNRMEYRPLEGFVFAVTPFNFLSIAGNLPTAPAIMGNVVVWKPASSAVYPAYVLMQLFREAGLPDGVINFIPGPGSAVGPEVLASSSLAGIHFTGSTKTFQSMWKTVGNNIAHYRSYPRIVGETGGKDFVVAHESADIRALMVAMIRGAFEYQGQKCSAVSRAYIARNLWEELRVLLVDEMEKLTIGDVEDFSMFMNAVIDRDAYERIAGYIDFVKRSSKARILFGGGCDDRKGFFIQPTLILTEDPHFRTMEEEIFGPVLTVYLYDEGSYEETLTLCDSTSPYGLTGAVFARDRTAIALAEKLLRNAAGNFYINDKPTGAVVGQQPFGGGRASGTNDKAGSLLNMLRWVTPRAIKENFVPPHEWRYPFMREPWSH
jgi:1-pyrroline-5-carboxylate dehydrogenase